jgi:transposase
MTTLIDALVPDDLSVVVQPLLPPPPRPRWGGRRRTIPDRNCLAAIVFMARTSTPWRLLPAQELGCGSPATVWRRLNEWATAGVFEQLHLEILERLGVAGRLDWSRAIVDSMSVRAKGGGTTLAQALPWQFGQAGRYIPECDEPIRHQAQHELKALLHLARRCRRRIARWSRSPPRRLSEVLKAINPGHRRWRPGPLVEDAGLSDRQMQQCPLNYHTPVDYEHQRPSPAPAA